MKKLYNMYVVSRVHKGRRTYLKDDLRGYSDKITEAKFYDSKQKAMAALEQEKFCDENYIKLREYHGDKNIRNQWDSKYELIALEMRLKKEDGI